MIRVFFIIATIVMSFQVTAKTLNPGKPYMVFLRPGSVLTKISDRKEVAIEKGFYANVLEIDPNRRDTFLVYNKNGVAVYETATTSIVEVADDLRILPKYDAEISYPAPQKFQVDDENSFFDTQFNIHYDNLLTTEFNSIYSDQLESVFATRFELRTLYVSTLPVNMGLNLNYQSTSWRNDVDQVKLSILSFGPQIQRFIYKEENMAVSVLFGAEYAPVYRTSSGDSVETYQATLFDLGLESIWATNSGKWSIGAHLRRHDLTLKTSTREGLQPFAEEIIINSIGAMIGYKYEWNL
jgi:hypothetical protein